MTLEDAKILIGDDSILARKQIKDIISQYGSPVFLEASNGQDCIDMYKKEKPTLVFLDIVMPVKDGNAAIREIIDFDKNADIIIPEGGNNAVALDLLMGRIQRHLDMNC